MTQSTRSKQMMELEDRLGCRLLMRGNKSVSLTEEGQFLRKQAEEIMELVEKTESAFHSGDELEDGDIFPGWAETPAMEVDIVAVTKKHQPLSPAAKVFMERLGARARRRYLTG